MATKKAAAAVPATKQTAKASPSTALVVPPDMEAFAGRGSEGMTKDDFAIPFLQLLQGLSPEVNGSTAIEGARAGLFINSITSELFSAVRVIPCAYQRRFVRWAPRATGGGYKGQYDHTLVTTNQVPGMSQHGTHLLMDVPKNTTKVLDDRGLPLFDHLMDTRYHFVLMQSANGSWQQAVIGFASTKIKTSKNWNAQCDLIKGKKKGGGEYVLPTFAYVYRLSAIEEKNAKGVWWGIDVTADAPVTFGSPEWDQAVRFNESVTKGLVNVAPPAPENSDAHDSSTSV